jgi:hypothetical protein
VAELNYTMSVLSRVGFGYHHDFANSPFVGGFYNMDAIYGAFQQMVASRVVTYLFGRYENRRFGAEAWGRTDNYIMGGAAIDYIIGKFLLVGASYSLNLNRSTGGPPFQASTTPSTVLLFRLGVMY